MKCIAGENPQKASVMGNTWLLITDKIVWLSEPTTYSLCQQWRALWSLPLMLHGNRRILSLVVISLFHWETLHAGGGSSSAFASSVVVLCPVQCSPPSVVFVVVVGAALLLLLWLIPASSSPSSIPPLTLNNSPDYQLMELLLKRLRFNKNRNFWRWVRLINWLILIKSESIRPLIIRILSHNCIVLGPSCKIGNMRCPGTLKNQNPQFEEKK